MQPNRWFNRQNLRHWLFPMGAFLLFIALTVPIWKWLWYEWMSNSYYSHGMLILPVTVYLVIRRIQLDKQWRWRSDSQNNRGMVILAASLGIYLYFLDSKAYYLAAFAVVGIAFGLLWTIGGYEATKKLVFPVGYLLLMIPLPYLDRITLPLALFTGVCSGALVKFLGLGITIIGNAISLPNANLVIGAQCSGVNSIISLTSLNVLIAYLMMGPWWGRIALTLLAIPIAMIGNILRVANLLFVANRWGGDAAFRFYHDYSGIVFFVVALVLLVPLTKLLRCNRLRMDVI